MSPPDTGRPLSEPKRFWPYSQFGYATKLVLKILFAVLAPPAFMLPLVLLVSYAKVGHPPDLISIFWKMAPNERGFVLISWIFHSVAVFDIVSIALFRLKFDDVSTELPLYDGGEGGGGNKIPQPVKLTAVYPIMFLITWPTSFGVITGHIS